jgi:hypothetical protein
MGLVLSTAGAFRCKAPGLVAGRRKAIRRPAVQLPLASGGSAVARTQHDWSQAAQGRMLVAYAVGCSPSCGISWREAQDGAGHGRPWRDPGNEGRQSLALR